MFARVSKPIPLWGWHFFQKHNATMRSHSCCSRCPTFMVRSAEDEKSRRSSRKAKHSSACTQHHAYCI